MTKRVKYTVIYKKCKLIFFLIFVLSRRIKGSFGRLKVFVSDRSKIFISNETLLCVFYVNRDLVIAYRTHFVAIMPRAFWTFQDQCFVHIWILTMLAGIFSLSNDCVVRIEMRRRESNRILWPETYINAQHSIFFSVDILLLRRWHELVLFCLRKIV